MSVKVYTENGEFVRYLPNIIDTSIFVDATVEEIEIAMEKDKPINGYRIYI